MFQDMVIKEINGNRTKMFDNEFKMGRRTFKKIAEDERWYIFEVDINETPRQPKEQNLEVILKRIGPKNWLDTNNEYTHVEKYPSDELWGVYGWTATNIEYAYRIIHRINEKKGWGDTALGLIYTPLKEAQMEPLSNYEGTEQISPHIKQGWMMYN